MAGLLPGATPATIRAARAADAPARPFGDTTVREIARDLATKPFAQITADFARDNAIKAENSKKRD